MDNTVFSFKVFGVRISWNKDNPGGGFYNTHHYNYYGEEVRHWYFGRHLQISMSWEPNA